MNNSHLLLQNECMCGSLESNSHSQKAVFQFSAEIIAATFISSLSGKPTVWDWVISLSSWDIWPHTAELAALAVTFYHLCGFWWVTEGDQVKPTVNISSLLCFCMTGLFLSVMSRLKPFSLFLSPAQTDQAEICFKRHSTE